MCYIMIEINVVYLKITFVEIPKFSEIYKHITYLNW